MFAPGFPYNESHRHFSHLMAIHPLGLIRWEDGEKSQAIINSTLAQLEAVGPDYWCGYSYSWLGNLYARAKNGSKAAEALRIFAGAFCLPKKIPLRVENTPDLLHSLPVSRYLKIRETLPELGIVK